jgi:hypothetical protein
LSTSIGATSIFFINATDGVVDMTDDGKRHFFFQKGAILVAYLSKEDHHGSNQDHWTYQKV